MKRVYYVVRYTNGIASVVSSHESYGAARSMTGADGVVVQGSWVPQGYRPQGYEGWRARPM